MKRALVAGTLAAGLAWGASPACAQRIVRSVRGEIASSEAASVALTVNPPDGAIEALVVEQPPDGWEVSSISDGGQFLPGGGGGNDVVMWGLAGGDLGQYVLSYQVSPPEGASGFAEFGGDYSFDLGAPKEFVGDRFVIANDAPDAFGSRDISPVVIEAGESVSVQVDLAPAQGSKINLLVTESIPNGWTPSNISSGGFFNNIPNGRNSIRWFLTVGPGQSVTLTYDMTAPANASGQYSFWGEAGFDAGGGETVSQHAGDRRVFVRSARTVASNLLGKVELTAEEAAGHELNATSGLDSGDAVSFVNSGRP